MKKALLLLCCIFMDWSGCRAAVSDSTQQRRKLNLTPFPAFLYRQKTVLATVAWLCRYIILGKIDYARGSDQSSGLYFAIGEAF